MRKGQRVSSLLVIYNAGELTRTAESIVSLTLACKSVWKLLAQKHYQYLKDFKEIRKRIDAEARQADMIESKRERQRQEAHRMELVRMNRKEKLHNALRRISSYDYKGHHRIMQEQRHTGTANWLFDYQPFQDWLLSPFSSPFGCFGIPGSGKTILTCAVIDHLALTQPRNPICYHYCSYDYASSLKATAILGTFLQQILERQALSDTVEENLLQDLQDSLDFPRSDTLYSILSKYFKTDHTYFLILDGLDELPRSEQSEVATFIETALTQTLHCAVKIFISCRPEAIIEKDVFRPWLSITISPQDIVSDIKSFVESEIEERVKGGELKLRDPDLKDEVIDRLTQDAGEM